MDKKTIAIDASRAIRRQKTGVEWYAYRLLGALMRVAPADWWVELLVDRQADDSFPALPENWSWHALAWPPRFLWSQIRLAARLLRARPALYFSPVHVLPFFASRPAVVTIHDVDYMTHPEAYSWKGRNYLRLTTWWAVRAATLILTPSEASKENLVRYFRCDPKKIRVTPLAPMVDVTEVPVGPEPVRTYPYFLAVGRLETKKNTARLVEAFAKVAGEMPETRLVFVGRPGRGYENVKAAIEAAGLGERIEEAGWLPGDEVLRLSRGAVALMFPSLAEGFGIPILDGFALGVPVVTSRGIATEETAGGSAYLVDPFSVEEIAESMRRLYRDPALREGLVDKGAERVKGFSWERTARMTIAAFEEILGRDAKRI